ncbi:winged helix-turn-helix domain-containing protein, partial [Peribacillus sp. NPDC056705]|uniref:winged helix-turn-helix domain-containing protein n=1 Tax=Peribacillus sp. NPDC056705 TaxID=3345918 RepID=UPI00374A7D4E
LRLQDTHRLEEAEQGEWLTAADLRLNESTREVLRDGKSIELTPREFDLLVYLLKNKRQVLNRDQILAAVWGYDYYGDTNVVDVYIRYVRKKIDQDSTVELIHTVRGVGYVLKDSP